MNMFLKALWPWWMGNLWLYVCMYVYVSPACCALEFTLPALVCTCITVGRLYNKAIPCSFHAGGSLVVAEDLDQSNASHAISHKRTMSQETLAGVYKRANSLLGHPLIQVTLRCSNYCENCPFNWHPPLLCLLRCLYGLWCLYCP